MLHGTPLVVLNCSWDSICHRQVREGLGITVAMPVAGSLGTKTHHCSTTQHRSMQLPKSSIVTQMFHPVIPFCTTCQNENALVITDGDDAAKLLGSLVIGSWPGNRDLHSEPNSEIRHFTTKALCPVPSCHLQLSGGEGCCVHLFMAVYYEFQTP